MKKILLFSFSMLIFSATRAQFFPGNFYHDLGYTTTTSACVIDSSFYAIRYGGVERLSLTTRSTSYLWDRFYPATKICPAPDSSMALLKSGLVYRYFPLSDSLVNISNSLAAATVTDVSSSASVIWATVAFDEIGRYDSAGWHIISLGSSSNFLHILPVSDTSAYLADNSSIRFYSPAGLSAPIYNFITPGSFSEWVSDTSGIAWIIADSYLIKMNSGGAINLYSNANTPLQPGDIFTHVAAGKKNLWASTRDDKFYELSGATWSSVLPFGFSTENLVWSPSTDLILAQAQDTIFEINDSTYFIGPGYDFRNMPYQHIKAISTDKIATNQGIFTYAQQYPPMTPLDFQDTSRLILANDVNCFVVCDQSTDAGYGTHHGIYGTNYPINNANLPDSNINYIFYAMGSYYICTNKGLCVYNQIIYTTYDTSNSALPSDSVTFAVSYMSPYTNAQELWVGTRAGVALYSNGVWKKYDTSVVHIQDFNVTGILPCPLYYANRDTSVWITTLGSGLVELKRNGQYTVLNTANGGFRDDSLYYVTQYQGCFYASSVVIGTNSNGIAYYQMPYDTFSYSEMVNLSGYIIPYHQSNLYVNSFLYGNYYSGEMIMVTDQGFNYIGMCLGEGVNDIPAKNNLLWYQVDDHQLQVRMPDGYSGDSGFELYDVTGRKILAATGKPVDSKVYLDITDLTSGIYVLRLINENNSIQAKILISK